MTPIIHCRMCLTKVEPKLDLGATPIANAFTKGPEPYSMRIPLGVSECPKCGHVQISNHVSGETLFTNYSYRTPEAERVRLSDLAKELAERYPNALSTAGGTKSGKMPTCVEIGSNSGIFVQELNKVGIWAVGIDPSNPDPGGLPKWFNTKTARMMAMSMGKMKLIVSNNTFAHVDDLRNVLLGVSYLLDDDGALVFEVQYFPASVAGGMFDMIYHEHKDYHLLKTWPPLLEKFGMVVTRYEHIPTHGGSIRIHVQRGLKGIDVPSEVIDWDGFREKIRAEKERLIGKIERVSGRVVAFGATAKATTLIHTIGVKDKIAYCVDETPEKIGKYLPGTSIQISSPERMKDEPPAAVLLTAWNYADQLRGRFNVPLIVPFEKTDNRKAA